MTLCDSIKECHNPEIIGEDNNAIRVYCTHCGAQARIGKDAKGNPEHFLYGEWFKKDVAQPGSPLFYKYAGAKGMNVL